MKQPSVHNILLKFPHKQEAGLHQLQGLLGVCFLAFWLTNINPGKEDPGKLQEGAAGTFQHLPAPVGGADGCRYPPAHFPGPCWHHKLLDGGAAAAPGTFLQPGLGGVRG